MSTLTSIFGMLPLMVVPGVGSQIYRGLATVIIGGMFVSALFTLVLIPSILRLPPLTDALRRKSVVVPTEGAISDA
jgi:Cu/Ag efflux pump CusA